MTAGLVGAVLIALAMSTWGIVKIARSRPPR
jgi:hypothetical protein